MRIFDFYQPHSYMAPIDKAPGGRSNDNPEFQPINDIRISAAGGMLHAALNPTAAEICTGTDFYIGDFCPASFGRMYKRLWEILGEMPEGIKVLEIGINKGNPLRYYEQNQIERLIGIDNDPEALKELSKNYPAVEALYFDAFKLSSLQTATPVSAVIGTNIAHHARDINELTNFIDGIDNVLKERKDGKVIQLVQTAVPHWQYWFSYGPTRDPFQNFMNAYCETFKQKGYTVGCQPSGIHMIRKRSDANEIQRKILDYKPHNNCIFVADFGSGSCRVEKLSPANRDIAPDEFLEFAVFFNLMAFKKGTFSDADIDRLGLGIGRPGERIVKDETSKK